MNIVAELLAAAKEVMAKDMDFEVKSSRNDRGATIEVGTVKAGGKKWPAFRVLIPGRGGYAAITAQRFNVGDKVTDDRGKVFTVADVKTESNMGQTVWRYTFSDRSWVRDMADLKGKVWSDWLAKSGTGNAVKEKEKLDKSMQNREDQLSERKDKKSQRLQERVEDGTLKEKMEVYLRKGDSVVPATIIGFNLENGKILVRENLTSTKSWVERVYAKRNDALYELT